MTPAVAEEGWRSLSWLSLEAPDSEPPGKILTNNRIPMGPVTGEEVFGQCFRTVVAASLDWVLLICV